MTASHRAQYVEALDRDSKDVCVHSCLLNFIVFVQFTKLMLIQLSRLRPTYLEINQHGRETRMRECTKWLAIMLMHIVQCKHCTVQVYKRRLIRRWVCSPVNKRTRSADEYWEFYAPAEWLSNDLYSVPKYQVFLRTAGSTTWYGTRTYPRHVEMAWRLIRYRLLERYSILP